MTQSLIYVGAGATRPDFPARDIDHAELVVLAGRAKIDPDDYAAAAVASGMFLAERHDATPAVAEPELEPTADASDKPLEEMSRDELRQAAADLGLGQAGTKADLLERIRAKLAEDAPA